jgi:hypothetical protein
MMKLIKISLVLAVVAAVAIGIIQLRRNSGRLRHELSELRRRTVQADRLQEENRRLQMLVAETERTGADAASAAAASLEQARRELAELEERSRRARTRQAEQTKQAELNRDPEKGPAKLEHFQNVGRGSPALAFQTLVWAALKADAEALVGVLSVTGAARARADALIARLPESTRSKYPDAESLAAIAVTGEMLKGGPLEILGYTTEDPAQAIVTVRVSDGGKTAKLPMRLGPGGWQFVVPEAAITGIERRMNTIASDAPQKK